MHFSSRPIHFARQDSKSISFEYKLASQVALHTLLILLQSCSLTQDLHPAFMPANTLDEKNRKNNTENATLVFLLITFIYVFPAFNINSNFK